MALQNANLQSKSFAFLDKLYIDEFTRVSYNKEHEVLICEALKEYIPIDDFKKVFHFISLNFSAFKVRKFIFDKQKLRVFHQPSMEWYFVFWKREMLKNYDLKVHNKILPQNVSWFEASVKAGRKSIAEKYPHLSFDEFIIEYKSTLEEAILS